MHQKRKKHEQSEIATNLKKIFATHRATSMYVRMYKENRNQVGKNDFTKKT